MRQLNDSKLEIILASACVSLWCWRVTYIKLSSSFSQQPIRNILFCFAEDLCVLELQLRSIIALLEACEVPEN